ncbi:MAG: hypothetical protein MI794_09450 [Pseudomonadales bacterium]|uniref:hypothetical protein n=1 Tax=Marinobacter xestospongiae TaxID=994319 RepID=UPI0020044DF1|nr:hypothetical protein [Marinobacter xestospongiae]MCG8518203.1 hypothetical protein [Pseudomonadales bacterium]MCK7567279.1 hypothetical protein [Marinobacter xestospongiae]
MFYRVLTLLGAVLFVIALFGLLWLFCRRFLQRHGVVDQLTDRTTVLATWTFAGVAIGLVFAGVGALLLGPWAFYRTLRGHDVAISDAAAMWWGLGIVLAALLVTGSGFAAFLYLVGAV